MNIPTQWANTTDEYIAKAEAIISNTQSHPLITWTTAPHASYTNDNESLIKTLALSQKHHLKIHIHLHETQDGIDLDLKRYQQRPIERLHQLGLLNNQLIAVHMTQVTDEELWLLSNNKVNIVHCPESNMKLASGFARIGDMISAGINVALGTDGAASNNDLDMFSEMRTAALLAKGVSQNPTVLPCETAIEMATINGAKALGIDHITGSLEINKAADVIAIDMSDYSIYPTYNPLSHLVYCCNRHQVSEVWIAGKHLLHRGQLTQLNIEQTMSKAEEIINTIRGMI